MADHHQPDLSNGKATVLLIGVGSTALVVTIYHCIVAGWCNRRRTTESRRPFVPQTAETLSGIENSSAQLIPAHKYQKGLDLVGEDSTCAVCLCEFEEGEELRTLPECVHSYHAPCIDKWLYSHSNCPKCRADATPSPQILPRSSDSGPRRLDLEAQDIPVQSRTA